MKHCLLGSLFFIVLVTTHSCDYDNEETLFPQDCDTTMPVTYTLVIAPLVQSRCMPCHNAEAIESNIPLVEYDNLKAMVDGERLLGAIHHDEGFIPMPQNMSATLPECELYQFDRWVAEGAQNN